MMCANTCGVTRSRQSAPVYPPCFRAFALHTGEGYPPLWGTSPRQHTESWIGIDLPNPNQLTASKHSFKQRN